MGERRLTPRGASWMPVRWAGAALIAALTLSGTLLTGAVPAAAAAGPEVSFYVAPTGSGTACSTRQPCLLTQGQTAARKALSDNKASPVPVTVVLQSGYYDLQAPLALNQADSGVQGAPMTYRAAAGARPVLSGGQSISGWQLVDANLNRWAAPAPVGIDSRGFYVDDVRVPRTRNNNPQGLFGGMTQTASGYTTGNSTLAGWRNQPDIEFSYLGGQGSWEVPRCLVQSSSGTTIAMRPRCWSNVHYQESVVNDVEVTMPGRNEAPLGYGPALRSWHKPTAVENAFELLGSNSWYLDKAANKLYYQAPAGQSPQNKRTVLAKLESVLTVTGSQSNPAHDVTLSGLTFADTTWKQPNSDDGYAAVQATLTLSGGMDQDLRQGLCQYATAPSVGTCPYGDWTKSAAEVVGQWVDRLTVTGNLFTRGGAAGLDLYHGIHDAQVNGNEFTGLSGNGLYLGSPDDMQVTGTRILTGNTISNNKVHKIGVEYPGAVGIWIGYTQRTTVTHNQLNDLPYSGISFGWGGWHTDAVHADNPNINADNKITNNLIFSIMQVLHDGAPIYTNGIQAPNWEQALDMSGNVVHDADGANYLYYTDRGSSYVKIHDNVAYDVGGDVHFTGGCMPRGWITVDNNWTSDTSYNYNGCGFPPSNITIGNFHVIPNNPAPGDIPPALLANAGIQAADGTGPQTGRTYTLTAVHSGKVADVSGRSPANDGPVIQWAGFPGAANQQWKATDAGNGTFTLAAAHSGKCLNVTGASADNFALIAQYTCAGGVDQQQWRFEPASTPGAYRIVSVKSGKCVDVPGSSQDNVQLIQYTCANTAPNQQWKLTQIG